MADQEEWPAYADQDPDGDGDGPDDAQPDLELVQTDEPVPPSDRRLPVETLEGEVLPAIRDRPHRRIVPGQLQSPQIFIRYVSIRSRQAANEVGYQISRSPVYWWRLARRSPAGLGRILVAWKAWVNDDLGGEFLRSNYRDQGGPWERVYARRDTHQFVRLVVSGLLLLLVAVFAIAAYAVLDTWLLLVIAAAGVAIVGRIGLQADVRIVDNTAVFEQPRLTYDLLLAAFGVLGIEQLNRSLKEFGPSAVPFRSPLGYKGRGWQVEVDLPAGCPASKVVEKRDELASALFRPVSAVYPATVPDVSANRLSLYVADKPLSQMKQDPWPLARTGQTSVFEPFVIGQDPMGQPVTITLIFTNGVCGAMPRMGKTFSYRLIALGAALDPTCDLHIYNLKGGPDWAPLKPVSYRYRSGESEEDFDYLMQGLRELKVDMAKRYKTLEQQEERDPSSVPEGKITPELAARADLGLHPILLVIDEVRVLFTDPRYKAEAITLVLDLVARGPAAGIMAYVATQSVKKETVPPLISNMAVNRLCFKVANYSESNLVLGNLSGAGYNAATFLETEKAIGYLVGEGSAPTVVRFSRVDGLGAKAVVKRAREIRSRRGRLTGYAAGIELESDRDQVSTLEHIADVWPGGAYSATFDEIAAQLTQKHPVVYANWTGDQVRATCKPARLRVVQIRRDGEYRGYGIVRQELDEHLRSGTVPAIENSEEDR